MTAGEQRSSGLAAGRPWLVAVLVAVAACSPAPTDSPSPGPASSAATWSVADVRQSSRVTDAPESLPPGVFCSPCHPPAQNLFFGLATEPHALLAVGVEQPPARPIVFESTDGQVWRSLADLPGAGPGSAAAAVTMPSRTVIVGSAGRGAASWARAADGTWMASPQQDSLTGPTGGNAAMTSVVASGDQVVAAGYVIDPSDGSERGAVWRSANGLTWTMDPSVAAFAGARILGVAVLGSTIVAVGTLGDPTYGSAGAWWWTADHGWRRAEVAGSDGAMRAVVAILDPAGAVSPGFVAVGHGPGDHGAAVWASSDGSSWEAVPDQPAFHVGGHAVRMLAVAAGPDGLVAGGWREDAANGSTAAWRSADGQAWDAFDWVPSFSGGEMEAVASWQGLLVGAGRTGYPDNNQATVWTRPAD